MPQLSSSSGGGSRAARASRRLRFACLRPSRSCAGSASPSVSSPLRGSGLGACSRSQPESARADRAARSAPTASAPPRATRPSLSRRAMLPTRQRAPHSCSRSRRRSYPPLLAAARRLPAGASSSAQADWAANPQQLRSYTAASAGAPTASGSSAAARCAANRAPAAHAMARA
eukprot:scaffold3723_cov112-Isochrysis_galbana.AAC.7